MYKPFFYLCIALFFPEVSHAQPRIALGVTKICIHEAGFQIHRPMSEYTNDCAAIVTALRNRSSVGRVTRGIMRAYSTRVFDRTRTDSRAYIPWITLSRTPPRHWPSNLSWSRYRQRTQEIYDRVEALLDGRKSSPCDPDHWGALVPKIFRRVQRFGWRRVDCGDTLNGFWSIR